MYLLDTDTIIYILKGNPAVEKNLRRHYDDPIKISVITLMKLYLWSIQISEGDQ
jgi:predicted nucleic acid-binding protein